MKTITNLISNPIYLGIALLVVLIILFIIFFTKKGTKHKEIIEDLEKMKIEIQNFPLQHEINKIKATAKNEVLMQSIAEWEVRLHNLREKEFTYITDKLIELDQLLERYKYKEVKKQASELKKYILNISEMSENLYDEITKVSDEERKNRIKISDLKEYFRTCKDKKNKNQDIFMLNQEIDQKVEETFDHVNTVFKSFDEYMEKNNYIKAYELTTNINEMLSALDEFIDDVPDILALNNFLLNHRFKDFKNDMELEDINIDVLKIPDNIEEIALIFKNIQHNLLDFNTEHSLVELNSISKYIDKTYYSIENEKNSKNVFQNELKYSLKVKEEIYFEISALEKKYDEYDKTFTDKLFAGDIEEFSLSQNELVRTLEKISLEQENQTKAYSVLANEAVVLNERFNHLMNFIIKKLQAIEESFSFLNEVKKGVLRLQILMHKTKHQLHENKINLKNKDFKRIYKDAEESIEICEKFLNENKINLEQLRIKYENSTELLQNLFNTTKEFIDNALFSEKTIIYGNRYRGYSENFDRGLDIACSRYMDGYYNESLKISIKTIEIVEPSFMDKLKEVYEN